MGLLFSYVCWFLFYVFSCVVVVYYFSFCTKFYIAQKRREIVAKRNAKESLIMGVCKCVILYEYEYEYECVFVCVRVLAAAGSIRFLYTYIFNLLFSLHATIKFFIIFISCMCLYMCVCVFIYLCI